MDKEIFVHDSKNIPRAAATLSLKKIEEGSPIYSIKRLCVIKESDEGKSYGNKLIKKINSFLDEKGAEGVAINRIKKSNPAQNKLYENGGWELQGNGGRYSRPKQ